MELELQLLEFDLAIAKLTDIDQLEKLVENSSFISITKTDDEISLVIESGALPDNQFANVGWNAFKLIGPLDFSLVGILQKVIQPLSENGISIFTISTFNTDYVLVKKEQIETAIALLKDLFVVHTSA